MNGIDITKNRFTNLIPVIKPGLKNERGIKTAILYRVCPCVEIDSSEVVRETYVRIYGNSIPESADTIFNAFVPFLDFCRAKLMLLKYKIPSRQKDLLLLVLVHLDEIFENYRDLEDLFNRYFDLMYSFSNLMPVPKYFNGSKNIKGKGTWGLNNDYPSVYYKNLKDNQSGIYDRENMKLWIDGVMDSYKIKDMYELEPPYPIDEYYGFNDAKLDNLMLFIKNAIRLIEDRFA